MGHCINCHLLQNEDSLITVEICTNLRASRQELRGQYITMSIYQNNRIKFSPEAYDLESHGILGPVNGNRHELHIVQWAINPTREELFSHNIHTIAAPAGIFC